MARILVAEDNPTNLELITTLLKAFGHEALEAHDGEEALEVAQRERPDLILMDIHMPVMDGYDAVRRLRKDSTFEGTPMIAITALAMVGDREKILQAGFDGYIPKPIDPENFVQQLDPYLLKSVGATKRRAAPTTAETDPSGDAPVHSSAASKGLSVLVVDNVATNIQVLRGLLEPFGYEVISASRAEDAFGMLHKKLPDLIISDVHMPGMSGYNFIKAVKAESGLRDIPFMFLSSTSLSRDEFDLAVRLGANKFVTRPTEPPKLLEEIEDLLASARKGPFKATILIADDRAVNRDLLMTLLTFRGHKVIEASDGMEALEYAKANRPHLIITDIVMPNMDGYDLAAKIRATPELADTPIIFYTATYLAEQAQVLAKAAGVRYVLPKPSDPETILRVVDAALGIFRPTESQDQLQVFTQSLKEDATTLLAKKLVEKTSNLEGSTFRLAAIIELGLALAAESNPLSLGQVFTDASRRIIGARWVAVSLVGPDRLRMESVWSSGARENTSPPPAYQELLDQTIQSGKSRRLAAFNFIGDRVGPGNGPIPVLVVPILEGAMAHGCACFFGKLGATEFTDEDERVALTLGAVLATAHEKACLHDEVQRRAVELQLEITERKRAEEELVKLRKAVDASGEVIFMTDRAGVFTFVNTEFTRLYGFTAEEVVGKTTPRMLKSGRTSQEDYGNFWRTIIDKRVAKVDWVNKTKDGRRVDIEGSANPILDERGEVTGFLGIQRDITARKRAAENLRASELRYRRLFEAAKDGILILDGQAGEIIDVNPFMESLLGYSHQELLGKRLWEIGSFKDKLNSEDSFRILQDNAYITYNNLSLQTIDGKRVEVEFVSNAYSSGENKVIQCNIRDMTERRQLEQQLLQAQKMEAVGRLAGGVAHDFNNLLTVINGYSEMMLGDLDAQDPKRSSLQEIKKAGERAAALTRQLLAFSRRQVLAPQILNLTGVVAGMDNMLRRLIGEDIDLLTKYGAELGRVKADPGQIEQVIMNLAVNARDAMPEGGKLTLETANLDLDEAYAQGHVAITPGSYVMLAVTDTGSGMDSETQAHIFEPFFTTKEKGKGTGLGLATVYGIVKQSGGFIWVYSEPGQGTTFKIYLPRVKEIGATVEPINTRPAPQRGSETILVVEDEEPLRMLVRAVLGANGYNVLAASRGEEALQICERQNGRIDLMLTDVIMPQMNGRELAKRLATVRPETKVLYMSGYTGNAIVHQGVLDPGTAFIQKPFTPDALARKVREVLNSFSILETTA